MGREGVQGQCRGEREGGTDDGLVVVHEVEEIAQVGVVALLLSIPALTVLPRVGCGGECCC